MPAFDLTNWMLVFVRVSAMLAVFPLVSMQNFPIQTRLALGALTAFLLGPGLPPSGMDSPGFVATVLLFIQEAGIGLVLGFVARLLFYILDFAGNLIALELGMNWGATLSPISNTRSEAPGLILFLLGAMIFLTLDMHLWLLRALERSYEILPAGGGRLGSALVEDMIGRTSNLFVLGLLMAAPVIAVSFLINLVFSVIARAVPQMNVFAESFSFRALAGLVVFGLTLNLISQHAVNYLRRLPEDVLRVAQLLKAT